VSRSRRPARTSALRVLVAGALLTTAAAAGVALPSAAHADEVAVAQARVDQLQNVVAETTRKLTDGTRRWEADQASLKRVRRQLTNVTRHLGEAEAVAAAGQAKLDLMARQLYTRPVTGTLQMMITQSPSAFLSSVEGVKVLNDAAGTNDQVILQAQVTRHRLKQQEAEAQQLSTRAQQLVARSATRLKALESLAQSTSDQLVAAQDALQAARGRKAAAERARGQRLARDRASRERAAQARDAFGGVAACTGKSTDGQQNGNLDPASLCPLWMAPGQRLRADAAAAFEKLSKYHAATIGGPLCVTDSYRSYSEQVDVYRRKPGLAAVPGTSEHGYGKAVDFCGGIQDSGSAAYNWMKATAGSFGWVHPDWAEPSGSKPEPWHWEFGTG
jgi:peptidoglycan hydrolase CwlO-like protein